MRPTAPSEPTRSSRFGFILASFVASLVLYTLSFPNFLFPKGIGQLAWVALCPLFAALPLLNVKASALSGAAYGFILYALSDYWLWIYHPAALLIACLYAAVLLTVLFPLLSMTVKAFPRLGYASWPFLWLSYEFLRSRGFMGYPYGVLGYAFWRDPRLLGLASAGGVWLVSLAALSVNSILGHAVRATLRARGPAARARAAAVPLCVALGLAALFSVSGGFLKTSYVPRGLFRVALIQPGFARRQENVRDYSEMTDRLIRLTDEAIRETPSLIIWHETSIVPPLAWHLRFRPNRDTFDLVQKADAYIRKLDVPLLFGNGRAEPDGAGFLTRRNWNSAFLFKDGREIGRYDKERLVPYSETFPFKKVLPKVAARIESEVGQFWERGKDLTVFKLPGASFSAPICFEDSFGDYLRQFTAAGADFLAVLTDDAWGRSKACQYQHLSQSALRAAELGIPIVRAANTGETVLLGPDGVLLEELLPFSEGFLIAEVPLPPPTYTGTLYRRIGDVVGWLALLVSAFWALLSAAVLYLRRKNPTNPGIRNT